MKKRIFSFVFFIFLLNAKGGHARSFAGDFASEMIRYGKMTGYFAFAGGSSIEEENKRIAFSGAMGIAFPFFRMELEYLNLDKKEKNTLVEEKESFELDAVFTNYYLGEVLYGGVGFGRGDWDGVTTDMMQFIGGIEIPLSRHVSFGAEYRRIKSDSEGEITQKRFDAQTVMGKLRIYF